jgi:hypothetical protein
MLNSWLQRFRRQFINTQTTPPALDNPRELRQKTLNGILTGLCRSQIFVELCSLPAAHNVTEGEVIKWYRKFDKHGKFPKKVPQRFRQTLTAINEEFWKIQERMEEQECPSWIECNLKLHTSRYAVEFCTPPISSGCKLFGKLGKE